MICDVSRLRERGVRISAADARPTAGDLLVSEMTRTAFGRALRIAQLLHPTRPYAAPELLPQLFDVQLIRIQKDELVLTGFERVQIDEKFVDFAQTWLAQVQK